MAKHIHADLMRLYYEDALETESPWERWEFRRFGDDTWNICGTHPLWNLEWEFRRKPKTININGFIFPEPMREAPAFGTTYYYASTVAILYINNPLTWTGSDFDMELLRRGVCHLTREASEIHTNALISFTEQKR